MVHCEFSTSSHVSCLGQLFEAQYQAWVLDPPRFDQQYLWFVGCIFSRDTRHKHFRVPRRVPSCFGPACCNSTCINITDGCRHVNTMNWVKVSVKVVLTMAVWPTWHRSMLDSHQTMTTLIMISAVVSRDYLYSYAASVVDFTQWLDDEHSIMIKWLQSWLLAFDVLCACSSKHDDCIWTAKCSMEILISVGMNQVANHDISLWLDCFNAHNMLDRNLRTDCSQVQSHVLNPVYIAVYLVPWVTGVQNHASPSQQGWTPWKREKLRKFKIQSNDINCIDQLVSFHGNSTSKVC